ncbi:hypothetical protein SLS55_009919 [Diplodia seriata]|uniref:Uncharacterized protein n=1 Tax=Diplodia seriata TaxID=420778 RepID=A0ABR3C1E6_9PEZI
MAVYPELAYLYDPPVPGSDGNGSRGALTPVQPPGGGHNPVGPFVVGNPGASSRDGVGGATADGGGTLGATMRGGGGSGTSSGEYDDDQYQRSTSPEGRSAGSRSSSVGSVVSYLGPAGRPPVMGAAAAGGGMNGSSSGSSNAALLAASAGRDRRAGDNTPAPTPSRADDETGARGEEARPFLTAAGAVAAGGSSGASSRDVSAEREVNNTEGAAQATHQRNEGALWNGDETERELGARQHEQQVEEARQRRERARAFLLQAKERQELIHRSPDTTPASAAAAAGAAAGAAALASRGQQRRLSNPKLQRVSSGKQQQWWQQFPQTSPTATSPTSPTGRFPPPAATHANSNYNPIYPPISPTYPRSGPILTSQHIEANRLQQAQHARATAAATSQAPTVTAYPTFHRPGPNYPPPSNWPQATPTNYSYTHGNAAAMAAAAANARGRPFFHQNTSYNPPHRATIDNYSSLAGASSAYSAASPPIVVNPPAPRRGSSGSIHTAIGGVYTTIPEEEGPAPRPQQQRPQQQQQQRQRKQSLTSIMRQMNALDEEDSDQGDEGQGFLQAPRRVLSVRNGAVTPSTDGEEEDARDGGARRHGHGHGHGAGRNLL